MAGSFEADTSEALLRRWQDEEDPEALDRLLRMEVEILKRMIRGRAGGLVQQSLGVTDVAHEAVLGFLKVETPPQFKSRKGLRSYLWTAAWRLLMHRLKQRKKKPLQLDGASSMCFQEALATTGGAREAEVRDQSVAMQLAMNLLKGKEREILRLVYLENQDLASAAERLGISKDAANMRLVRARQSLAAKLAGWSELIG